MIHRTLWKEFRPLADECLRHRFVRGLADGSLDRQVFRNYVAQDGHFLRVFLRAYAVLGARMADWRDAAVFVELQQGALEELKLHETFARKMKIDLEEVSPYPATRAYCDFLIAAAFHRSPGVALAGMTPCMRLYHHLGTELARGGIPQHAYADWIRTYSGAEFGALAERIEALLDRIAMDSAEVRDAYRYALRCEIDFFTAAIEAEP